VLEVGADGHAAPQNNAEALIRSKAQCRTRIHAIRGTPFGRRRSEGMTSRIRLLLGLLTCMTLPGVAGAQNPQPAPPQETHPPLAPPNASQPVPEQIAPAGRTPTTGKTTLSDKLSQQQGTLKPPGGRSGYPGPAAFSRPGHHARDTATRHAGR
jgi:hypothetical protein